MEEWRNGGVEEWRSGGEPDLVQEVPLVCTPGPQEEGEEGEQEDQGVRCQEWVKQVELETHRRDSWGMLVSQDFQSSDLRVHIFFPP